MCNNQGYIKIWRGILDECLYEGERFPSALAWIDLLLQAEYTDGRKWRHRGQTFVLQRGQVAASIQELADRWNMSYKSARGLLDKWEDEGQIERNGFIPIITITNYDLYQNTEQGQAKCRADLDFEGTQNLTKKGTQNQQENKTLSIDYKNEEIKKGNQNAEQKGKQNAEQNHSERARYQINIKEKNKEKENNKLFSKKKDSEPKKVNYFVPPTIEEVQAYLTQNNITDIDAGAFIDYYESVGWVIGNKKMKSWRHAIGTWRRNNRNKQNTNPQYGKQHQTSGCSSDPKRGTTPSGKADAKGLFFE